MLEAKLGLHSQTLQNLAFLFWLCTFLWLMPHGECLLNIVKTEDLCFLNVWLPWQCSDILMNLQVSWTSAFPKAWQSSFEDCLGLFQNLNVFLFSIKRYESPWITTLSYVTCPSSWWPGSAPVQANHGFLLLRSVAALGLLSRGTVPKGCRYAAQLILEVATGVLSGKRWAEVDDDPQDTSDTSG